MKVICLQNRGIDGLYVKETKIPTPKSNEVLVRINSVALNYRDLLLLKNGWAINPKVPFASSSAGAGVVVETGEGVTLWKKGDRVSTHYFDRTQAKNGQLQFIADYVIVPERTLAAIPSELSYDKASALSISGLAAWIALVEKAQIQPGETVMLQGTGGTSLLSLQLAKALGAVVIASSGSWQKIEKLKLLGADHVINYKETPEWQDQIKRITENVGADIVLDVIGADTIEKSIQATKTGGFVAAIGQMSGSETNLNLMDLIMKGITLQGIVHSGDIIDSSLDKLYSFVVAHKIDPIVDQVFQFNDVRHALEYLNSGNAFGKVIVKL